MQCPLCKNQTLRRTDLEVDLPASICDSCSGSFISQSDYAVWQSKHPGYKTPVGTPVQMDVAEITKAKICPQCGHILLKYRVGHGLKFFIDYCAGCGGIWLDKNEWLSLKLNHLHDNLYQIVSQSWQSEIRHDAVQERIEEVYKQRLGSDTFGKVSDFKKWLTEQPQKNLIVTYLQESIKTGK